MDPAGPRFARTRAARLRAAAAGVLIALGAALVAASPATDWLRGLSIDVLTALRWNVFGATHAPSSSPAVIVVLDEETFRTAPFEGSPSVTWTGEIGRVVTAVIDGGAKVVGFDIIFPTSIEQSEVPFGGETLGLRLRGFDRGYLRALALGARAGKLVLGEVQHQDHPVLPSPGQRAAVGHGANIRALNVYSDPDGVVRRIPLAFTVDGARVPAMAAELAARANGTPITATGAPAVDGTVTLNFAGGADAIPTYSLADLRACVEKGDKEFFRRQFAGKVVLLGTLLDIEDRKITSQRFATAPEGAHADRCALAAAPAAAASGFARDTISGVYVQATAVNNLLRGDALTDFARLGVGIASFLLAALAVIAALAFGPTTAVLSLLGLATMWCAGATFAFRSGIAVPLVEPLIAAFAALGAMIAWQLVAAERVMAAQRALERAREAEMASAAAIQRAMLPPPEQDDAGGPFDIAARMIPAREVGGDLYDIVALDANRLVITVGDVCGKGIPASLFMAVSQTVMRLAIRSGDDLKAEIEAANALLVANNREEMFTTLFCAVLDQSSGAMTYCNCGHNPPLLLRHGEDAVEPLRACGPPLGMFDAARYAPRAIVLAPGDMLVLYTDGVSEAEDLQSAQFGMERLEQALREMRGHPARAVIEHVVARVTAFAGRAAQSDDITCVALVRKPA